MIAFLSKIWAYVRPYQFRMILGLVCGVVSGLSNGGLILAIRLVVNLAFAEPGTVSVASQIRDMPAFVRPLLERLLPLVPDLSTPSSKLGLVAAVLSLPAMMFIRVIFGYLNVYLTGWASLHAVADLRTRLFDHLQNLSLSFFNKARTGELISRITNDTQILSQTISLSINALIKEPITVATLLAILISQQPRLTLISMLAMPLCIVPVVVYGRKVRRSVRAMQTHSADLASLMHESFSGNRIVKAYNLEDKVLAQFRQTTRDYLHQIMRTLRAFELPHQMNEFIGAIGVTLVFLYVILVGKTMTAGDFIQFIGSVFLMYAPVKVISRLHNQLEQARAASQRVFELLDLRSEIADPPQPVPLRAAGAEIRFESVDFDYGERPILRGIDLRVQPGQLVALVGASGSGKTTLTNLLLRFYDPQRGAVRIGGVDLRQVAVKELRRQVALVAQETILFNDTIRQNIAHGRPGATDAEIEAAARHAHAHEFILEKPLGYQTVVGEKGMVLSGGQRQRLAIARAILKDAPILVLDEATNALDTESERVVQAALEELMVGRTTVCIAHRLTTIQQADLIVVLDQGRIIETGTHAELIKRGGAYQKLYELQFQS
jgi:ATP-binding cassette, subfamily B, bacterial MsbA